MISVYGHLAVETTQVRLREKTMGHHAHRPEDAWSQATLFFPFG